MAHNIEFAMNTWNAAKNIYGIQKMPHWKKKEKSCSAKEKKTFTKIKMTRKEKKMNDDFNVNLENLFEKPN